MAKKCAIVIGHKKKSPGAVNKNARLSEFDFNDNLVRLIESRVKGVEAQRIYRRTYSSLPYDINEYDPDFIISLHCNAYDKTTTGTEVLYYHRSTVGKKLARKLQKKLLVALGLNDRGIRPRSSEDRGGYLLNSVKAPCVIAEPFFIDNNEDLNRAEANLEALAKAYADTIMEHGRARAKRKLKRGAD